MGSLLRQVSAARTATAVLLGLVAILAAQDAAGSPTRGAVSCPPLPRQQPVHLIVRPRWLPGTLVTEYFPVRESWFRGLPVAAPGLSSRHRVDWLYGAHGVAMNGEGIGLDGRVYHFAGPYNIDWVNVNGAATTPCWNGHWTGGKPAWYGGGGWRNRACHRNIPLIAGGWSNGPPTHVGRLPHPPRFARGASLPLDYWRRVAVDPKLIPLGSRVFVPAYCHTPAHGWFTAADVGGAIIARHVDVFRAPPPSLAGLHALWNQTIYVAPRERRRRVRLNVRRSGVSVHGTVQARPLSAGRGPIDSSNRSTNEAQISAQRHGVTLHPATRRTTGSLETRSGEMSRRRP